MVADGLRAVESVWWQIHVAEVVGVVAVVLMVVVVVVVLVVGVGVGVGWASRVYVIVLTNVLAG